jgi:peroxiredoxin (alkyl hydroperoxide reductase subunit C)
MTDTIAGGIPRIGDTAPDFTAITTDGEITFSQWQDGQWVVLFSHPADFTPVCTTELMEFARMSDEFKKRKVKLIGLSVDSIHSHLAWIENIREKLGVEIPFPLIADLDTKVAQKYGMIHGGASGTATVRAVFVIDPKRIVQALIYYPMSNGRNVDEILRLIDSLQMSQAKGVATPVNWRPGEKVVVPPAKTCAAVKERREHKEYDHKEFYLAFKQP